MTIAYPRTYKPYGPKAILIEWPARIEEGILYDILALERLVKDKSSLVDTVIAYHSLTIRYRERIDFDQAVAELKSLSTEANKAPKLNLKRWRIPVCYEEEFGIDLAFLAEEKNCQIKDIVQWHSAADYLVYFIGFQPGFLYLGGLAEKLHYPRRGNPRLRVAKGSVGIGGVQTGIYPQESAGGWQIIGRSPIECFDLKQEPPCFAQAGDRIQFEAISKEQYHQIRADVEAGNYQIPFERL